MLVVIHILVDRISFHKKQPPAKHTTLPRHMCHMEPTRQLTSVST